MIEPGPLDYSRLWPDCSARLCGKPNFGMLFKEKSLYVGELTEEPLDGIPWQFRDRWCIRQGQIGQLSQQIPAGLLDPGPG